MEDEALTIHPQESSYKATISLIPILRATVQPLGTRTAETVTALDRDSGLACSRSMHSPQLHPPQSIETLSLSLYEDASNI